ncbi:MAG: tetratricopeptide repeat protein [Acidobacteriota bacterium]
MRKVVGSWRLIAPLGRGGMGVVYRAVHVTSGMQAALKTVEIGHGGVLSSLQREILALARLRHPGIARILDHGVVEGVPWYAMELYEGRTLGQDIARTPDDLPDAAEGTAVHVRARQRTMADSGEATTPVPGAPVAPARQPTIRMRLEEDTLLSILTVVRRLCAPLAYMHGEGLVHRDLKPQNILVRPDGMPVILDFGLASAHQESTSRETLEGSGGHGGTAPYMPPEQWAGGVTDARADLYALGCILYELLVGRPPFVADNAVVMMFHHLQTEAEPPSAWTAGVPKALDELVGKLLSKDPACRLGHASAVANALARLGASDGLAEGPAPRPYLYRPRLQGRTQAIAELERSVSQSAGDIVFIGGESGVGKTRMMLEVMAIAARKGATVIAAQCAREGGPLAPARPVLQAVAEICAREGPAEARRLLGGRAAILGAFEPALADGSSVAELPPDLARERLFVSLADTFGALASRGPLAWLIDDVPWGDGLTLGFLEHLARRSPPLPLVVIAAYRREEAGRLASMLAMDRVRQVALERLTAAAVGEMVADMMALPAAPERLAAFLAGQSEGNPFFVAEYLRAALARDLIVRDPEGRWIVGKDEGELETAAYAELPLPGTLRAVILDRLEEIDAGPRALLEISATVGRDLDLRVLAGAFAAARLGENALLEALEILVRRQIVEEGGSRDYRFLHDKIREVAYERIDPARRKEVHRLAAEGMGALPAAEREDASIASHRERAGEAALARPLYLAAARAAAAKYAHEDAERWYRAAIRTSAPGSAELAAVQNELGDRVLQRRGRSAEALELHRQAHALALSLGSARDEGASLKHMGECESVLGRKDEARSLLLAAVACFERTGELPACAGALSSLGSFQLRQGRISEAIAAFERALAIWRDLRNRAGIGRVLANLAVALKEKGARDEALAALSEAIAIHREVGDRPAEGNALLAIGVIAREDHRIDDCLAAYQGALAIYRETGSSREEAVVTGNLASVLRDRGRQDESIAMLESVLGLLQRFGDQHSRSFMLVNLGNAYNDAGRHEEALDAQRTAIEIARTIGNRRAETYAHSAMGTSWQGLGRPDLAEESLVEALAQAEAQDDQPFVGYVLLQLASLDRARGMTRRALDRLAAAYPRLCGPESRVDLARWHAERGLVARDLREDGRAHAERARAAAVEARVSEHDALWNTLRELDSEPGGGEAI